MILCKFEGGGTSSSRNEYTSFVDFWECLRRPYIDIKLIGLKMLKYGLLFVRSERMFAVCKPEQNLQLQVALKERFMYRS